MRRAPYAEATAAAVSRAASSLVAPVTGKKRSFIVAVTVGRNLDCPPLRPRAC
jgi:hypothetical protein